MADPTPDSEAKQPPSRYTREQAIEAARSLTGQSPHIVAGALSGEDKDEFTENQVKKATETFVNRPEAGSE